MVTLLPITLLALLGEYWAKMVHINAHACMHTQTHACTHTRTHAHTHARMHTHTCTHTHRDDAHVVHALTQASRLRDHHVELLRDGVLGSQPRLQLLRKDRELSAVVDWRKDPQSPLHFENHSSKNDSGTLGFWFGNSMNTIT